MPGTKGHTDGYLKRLNFFSVKVPYPDEKPKEIYFMEKCGWRKSQKLAFWEEPKMLIGL